MKAIIRNIFTIVNTPVIVIIRLSILARPEMITLSGFHSESNYWKPLYNCQVTAVIVIIRLSILARSEMITLSGFHSESNYSKPLYKCFFPTNFRIATYFLSAFYDTLLHCKFYGSSFSVFFFIFMPDCTNKLDHFNNKKFFIIVIQISF